MRSLSVILLLSTLSTVVSFAQTTIRVNAGGTALTDASSNVWVDNSTNDPGVSSVFSTATTQTGCAADLCPLYQTERSGANFSMNYVVSAGTYAVTLKFSEIYFGPAPNPGGGGAGSRLFNVSINSTTVLSSFDIYANAGENTAVDRTFSVTTTGAINIQFTATVDNAKISAIQILPTATVPMRMTMGTTTPFTDSQGNIWAADAGTSGISNFSVGNAITSALPTSADQFLYQHESWGGNFTYTYSVPNGTYDVLLKFAELYWTANGQRTFNVSINGTQVLNNFDIFLSSGGQFAAIDKTFTTTVSTGQIAIAFTAVTDNAKIDAIQITATVGPPSITTTSPLPGAIVNVPYSFQFLGQGTLPITWTANNVPTGWTFSSSGLLTGTPVSTPGTFTINVAVHNANGDTNPVPFTLTSTVVTSGEFVCGNPCPFPSWTVAKNGTTVVGDGVHDDTSGIQTALNNLGTGSSDVLYFPAGTYKITSNIHFAGKYGVAVLGHDPADTIFKWAGPSAGCANDAKGRPICSTMLWADGVSAARYGRITWDGGGTAGIGFLQNWDAVTNPSGTGSNPNNIGHEDEVFKNMQKGIVAGGLPSGFLDSEFVMKRIVFTGCTLAGFSSESQNATDMLIVDSQFINNGEGIASHFRLGGTIYARRNFFSGNTGADFNGGGFANHTFTDNFSTGSNAFYTGGDSGFAGGVTINHNTILNTTQTAAIHLQGPGGHFVIDNSIVSKSGNTGPSIVMTESQPSYVGNYVGVGNKVTVTPTTSVCGTTTVGGAGSCSARWWTLDEQTVAANTINQTPPTMPPTPASSATLGRTIHDLSAGANQTTIAAAITASCAAAGNRHIVHFPKGNYTISSTISLPFNCDVQLVGDSWNSILNWTGGASPMFSLTGPSLVIFQDIRLNLNSTGDGVLITNADQSGGRIYLEGSNSDYGTGIWTEGLKNAAVDNFMTVSNSFSGQPFFRADGAGVGVGNAYIGLWGGNPNVNRSSNTEDVFRVTNGGRIIINGMWTETNTTNLVNANSTSGSIFLNEIHWGSNGMPAGGDNITVNGFNGLISAADVFFQNQGAFHGVNIAGENANTNVFVVNNNNDASSGGNYFSRAGSGGTVYFLNNALNTSQAAQVNDCGNGFSCGASGLEPPPAAFIRSSLSPLRTTFPAPLTNVTPGTTDVRLQRTYLLNAINGVHVKTATVPPSITSASPLPGGTTGIAYSGMQFAASGDTPFTWTSTNIPAGLTLSSSGLLSGTPTTPGLSTMSVTATNSLTGSTPVNFSITIAPGAPVNLNNAVSKNGIGNTGVGIGR